MAKDICAILENFVFSVAETSKRALCIREICERYKSKTVLQELHGITSIAHRTAKNICAVLENFVFSVAETSKKALCIREICERYKSKTISQELH